MVLQMMTPLCLKFRRNRERSEMVNQIHTPTDIEIKTNGIKWDYQNCSAKLQEQKEEIDLKEQTKTTQN